MSLTLDDLAQSAQTVYEKREINRNVLIPHVTVDSQDEFYSHMKTPDFSGTLFSSTDLMLREVGLLAGRLKDNLKVNIIDLFDTNGYTALPLIYEILSHKYEDTRELGFLNLYIPATASTAMNQSAGENLKQFSLRINRRGFKYRPILADITSRTINSEIAHIQASQPIATYNLFLLLFSGLGNIYDPARTLQNVYKSMNKEDYFLLAQNIKSNVSVQKLINDYTRFIPLMRDTVNLASIISPRPIECDYDGLGIRFFVRADGPLTIGQIPVHSEEEIVVCRSRRFDRFELEKNIINTGFKIEQIVIDREQTHAMYLLRK
jgi:hypothetical protein